MKENDEKKLCEALAEAVRGAMESRGVGLRELSRDADIPVGTLHHWIGATTSTNGKPQRGGRKRSGGPRFAIVAAVAHVLHVDLSTIVAEWAIGLKLKRATSVDLVRAGIKKKRKV